MENKLEKMTPDDLKYGADGLIPTVVQDAASGAVLTLAYMNRESVGLTLAEGRTVFFSRSRRKLWRKGETSGNIQRVVSLKADCDADALLVTVDKAGPACHTGAESCFFNTICDNGSEKFSADGLYELLCGRRESRPEGSYTSYLFDKGREKILKKIGEESTEVVVAAMRDSKAETIYELADLYYHAMVLMVEMGITPQELRAELSSRHVIDKKAKQETAVCADAQTAPKL